MQMLVRTLKVCLERTIFIFLSQIILDQIYLYLNGLLAHIVLLDSLNLKYFLQVICQELGWRSPAQRFLELTH